MYTEDFVDYLKKEKHMSENTTEAYNRDVTEFIAFEGVRGMTDLSQCFEHGNHSVPASS